jgi:hypothetical protein
MRLAKILACGGDRIWFRIVTFESEASRAPHICSFLCKEEICIPCMGDFIQSKDKKVARAEGAGAMVLPKGSCLEK